MKENPAITRAPDIAGGDPVFRGTRVPVSSLFRFLASGRAMDEFLEAFPTVERAQVERLLRGYDGPGVRGMSGGETRRT